MIKSLVTPLALILSALYPAQAASAQAPAEASDPAARPQTILDQRAADVVAVLRGELDAEEVFDQSFLMAVSPEMLAGMHDQLTAQFGAIQSVASLEPRDATSGTVTFRFERATGSGPIILAPSAPYRIVGLQLAQFVPNDNNPATLVSDLEALPGEVGVLFAPLDDGAEPVLALNETRQFAIGSTFKLYILSALARSIEAGERNWTDVVQINRKSFPSGQMQNWPMGAPVTLQTLATMMISISDNTATDILLHELGRSTVEAELKRLGHSDPARTLPFLSTLEMFALKGSEANMRKYIAGDETVRRLILADFEDDVGGDPDKVTPPRFVEPTAIDTVEWFASGRDLQNVARRLSEMQDPVVRSVLGVSKALPAGLAEEWNYVGYKGGSEPGVLNLTWLLQAKDGRWYVLAMSWNNPDAVLDNQAFELLAQRALALVK